MAKTRKTRPSTDPLTLRLKEERIVTDHDIDSLGKELREVDRKASGKTLELALEHVALKARVALLEKATGGIWKTADGTTLTIRQMTTAHLKNAIQHLQEVDKGRTRPDAEALMQAELKRREADRHLAWMQSGQPQGLGPKTEARVDYAKLEAYALGDVVGTRIAKLEQELKDLKVRRDLDADARYTLSKAVGDLQNKVSAQAELIEKLQHRIARQEVRQPAPVAFTEPCKLELKGADTVTPPPNLTPTERLTALSETLSPFSHLRKRMDAVKGHLDAKRDLLVTQINNAMIGLGNIERLKKLQALKDEIKRI